MFKIRPTFHQKQPIIYKHNPPKKQQKTIAEISEVAQGSQKQGTETINQNRLVGLIVQFSENAVTQTFLLKGPRSVY